MSESTNPPPRKAYTRVSKAKLLEAIRAQHGNIAAIAKAVNIDRKTAHDRIKKDPALQRALADERETFIDYAESALAKAVSQGEAWAVCFTLKTIGKSRGYIERYQVEHEWTRDAEQAGIDPAEIRTLLVESIRERLQLAAGGGVAGSEVSAPTSAAIIDAN